MLSKHKDICMSVEKEPTFFLKKDLKCGLRQYLTLFSLCKDESYCGESSPLYSETTSFPNTPENIYNFNSKSKIIYIVREPFSRFSSVYKQTMSSGHWYKKKYYPVLMSKFFNKAVFHYPAYIEATKYWTHIQNYRKFFPDSQIKVLMFDDMVNNHKNTMRDICVFLNISYDNAISDKNVDKNEGLVKIMYSPKMFKIFSLIPSAIRAKVPLDLKRRVVKFFRPSSIYEAELTEEEKEKVRLILKQEVEGLYSYLGLEEDVWNFIK